MLIVHRMAWVNVLQKSGPGTEKPGMPENAKKGRARVFRVLRNETGRKWRQVRVYKALEPGTEKSGTEKQYWNRLAIEANL